MNLAFGRRSVLVGLAGLVGIASTILLRAFVLSTSASILMRSSSMGGLVLDFLQR